MANEKNTDLYSIFSKSKKGKIFSNIFNVFFLYQSAHTLRGMFSFSVHFLNAK